ncbi:MAG: discoidin domain-containing protein [Kiritimatiellae bacterium]|nr:discoidin domain-containing protein [Kiritimatiellia bacterium]
MIPRQHLDRPFARLATLCTWVSLTALALLPAGCRRAERPPAPPEAEIVAEPPAPVAKPAGPPPPPKEEWTATASALQEDIFPAQYACDGKRETRWSSPQSDPQWLQIDLGRPAAICGMTILWETAFSSKYSIRVSLDGQSWKTVYQTEQGDGSTDEIFFAPVEARCVKIVGTERGTGWGHSIWEIDLKGLSEQPLITAPTGKGSQTSALLDGKQDTIWKSDGKLPFNIDIDFRQEKAFGGVRIDWGANHATELDMLVSKDAATWEKVSEVREGSGKFDVIMHPRKEARYIRMAVTASKENAPVEIKDITLRGPDEVGTPQALYELAAQKAKRGLYPMYLLKEQTFWTLVGLPGDTQESVFDEYGNFEPTAGGSSLMPYLALDGALISAQDAERVTQSLEDGHLPLPAVMWTARGLELKIQAFARGGLDDSATYVRYTVSNTSQEQRKGRLYLAVRPLQVNPPWQYGGIAQIIALESQALPEGTSIAINAEPAYIALTPPAAFGARPFDRGDILEDLARGRLPKATYVLNAGDRVSGALAYDLDLAPGSSTDVVVAAPLHKNLADISAFAADAAGDPGAAFERALAAAKEFWREQLDAVSIRIPQAGVAETMKSQVAYILINRDGVSIQPGSRNYKRCWIRDGSMTSAALLRMGLFDAVRDYLDWYAPRVQPNGWVPPILQNDGEINKGFGWDNEYDSQGQFVFAIMEYYRFTKDRAFLEKHFDAMHRAMKYMVELREQTLAPDYMTDMPARERFVGILPKSISHEGYSPAMHSYWDDFWALKGWKDGRDAAKLLGHDDIAQWAQEQYEALRDSTLASINATIAFKNCDFIPGCAEKGDCDPTSTSIAFAPCGEYAMLPQDALMGGYERYFKDLQHRFTPEWAAGFTPYEVRTITAFVKLGQKDRAKFLLDFILSYRLPQNWNVIAEVGYGNKRLGSYIGDMPHTWVGSGYINAVRSMLVYEEDGRLVLLAGAPEEWVRGEGLAIENLPTHYGTLNLAARTQDNVLTADLALDGEAPAGLELTWPLAGRPAKVTVDGEEWTDFDEKACRLPSGAKQVMAEW